MKQGICFCASYISVSSNEKCKKYKSENKLKSNKRTAIKSNAKIFPIDN